MRGLSGLFKRSKKTLEQEYMQAHEIEFHREKGYIVRGAVVNELNERLSYFSNRKLQSADDLELLYYKSLQMLEKIDLELATQRYVTRLGNTSENLNELKYIITTLNQYYREFKRDK